MKRNSNNVLSEFLINRRTVELKKSQHEIVEGSGLDQTNISRYERSGRIPLDRVREVAAAYQVSESTLMHLILQPQVSDPKNRDIFPLIHCITKGEVENTLTESEWQLLHETYIRLGNITPELVKEMISLMRAKNNLPG